MKIILRIAIIILTLSLTSCSGHKKNTLIKQSISSKQLGYIIDSGQIFTKSQYLELSEILCKYNEETTREIVIVTINNIKPYKDIQKYATDIGNKWGVGTAKDDNGLIIMICKPCKRIGIATGTGTELILTDDICDKILQKTIIPEFKNNNYYKGVKDGVTELIKQWR